MAYLFDPMHVRYIREEALSLTEDQLRGVSGIYRITSPSGRVYVGQAQDIAARWSQHRKKGRGGNHENRHLQASLAKYGVESHVFDGMELVSINDLDSREQIRIDAFFAAKASGFLRVMNLSPTAGSVRGYRYTEDQRERLTAAMNRPDVKERHVAALNRPEVKARHAAAIKEAFNRPEVKVRRTAAMKEAFNRPEVKARHAAAIKEAFNRPEVKAKRSALMKEAFKRPDVKTRHAAATKEALNRPEVKAKRSALIKEAFKRPDVKTRHYAAIRAKSPLTTESVIEIKIAIANGEAQKNIAKRYGVSNATISLIKTGKRWADIEIPKDYNQ
jgi:group I intron endonuclease